MRARAIWARRAVAALHKRINHNQHKRREKGPRRGHSRTFYPRAARSRSPFRPTSQVEHHPITLLRLAVKLICPDCVSAPMKAIHDRGPGIARPSTPSVPSASPTSQLANSPHELRTPRFRLRPKTNRAPVAPCGIFAFSLSHEYCHSYKQSGM
jgi:hypothetical protein